MEIDARVLKEVEFSTSLRGYNTDEVDEFLEKVTTAVERLQADTRSAQERAVSAERSARDHGPVADLDEGIRKTLVLAQRTADMAIKEAQDEAQQVLDTARADAQAMVEEARDSAMRITSDAERRLRDEVNRLTTSRDELTREVETLVGLLGAERARLAESLSTALRYVESSLTHSAELNSFAAIGASDVSGSSYPSQDEDQQEPSDSYDGEAPGEADADDAAEDEAPPEEAQQPEEVDDLEAGIAADAAAAAPSSRGDLEADQYDWDSVIRGRSESPFSSARMERPSLTALPARDAMQETGAWQLRAPRADWPA